CDGVTDLPKISSYICSVIMSQSLTMLRLSPYTSLFRSGPRRFGLAAAIGPVVPSPHFQHHGIRQHLAKRRLEPMAELAPGTRAPDRNSTRLNSSHMKNSYAVLCLETKKIVIIIVINNIK